MEDSTPSRDVVVRILDALRGSAADRGWQEFVDTYCASIARVISYCEREQENRADAFVFVCEQLRRDDCRRLRKFKLNGTATFDTWLHAVVRNLCRDWRRKKFGRHSRGEPEEIDSFVSVPKGEEDSSFEYGDVLDDLCDPRPDPLTAATSAEITNELNHAMSRLSSEQQLALSLRLEEGLTLQEISSILRLKNAQAADRLLREAIAELRNRMNVPVRGKVKPASV